MATNQRTFPDQEVLEQQIRAGVEVTRQAVILVLDGRDDEALNICAATIGGHIQDNVFTYPMYLLLKAKLSPSFRYAMLRLHMAAQILAGLRTTGLLTSVQNFNCPNLRRAYNGMIIIHDWVYFQWTGIEVGLASIQEQQRGNVFQAHPMDREYL